MFDTPDTHPTEPVTAITAGVESLAAEDRGHWHATTLSDRLIELVAIWERLGGETTRLTGQWNGRRARQADGALSPTAWLAHRSPIDRSKANRLVHTATMTTEHPEPGDALAGGNANAGRRTPPR
jgi:hypothetical protein